LAQRGSQRRIHKSIYVVIDIAVHGDRDILGLELPP
jgi:hypothetical protein